ncbi:MAG: hypothetical protein AB8G15_21095, partial [Saprospiraceae bacterium]
VQAAKYYSIHGLLLLAVTGKVLSRLLVNQDGTRELTKPNYCIKNILEKHGITCGEELGLLEKIKPIYQLLCDHRAFKEKQPKGFTKRFFKAAKELLATPIDATRFIDKTVSIPEVETNAVETSTEPEPETDHSGTFQFEYAN